MLTTLVKGVAWLLAGASSFAIADAAQQSYDQYRGQLSQLSPQAAPAASDAIASAVVEWKRLAAANGAAPFFDYANFLLAHPGWPDEMALRRAAERAMDAGSWSQGMAVSYFTRFPPLSAGAGVKYAQALQSVGRRDDAVRAARQAFAMSSLSAADEALLQSQFAGSLTPDDYDRRVDNLLWSNMTTSAARVLPMTSAARKPGFVARISLRTNAADAASYANSSVPGGDSDAGVIADKAAWLKLSGASGAARSLLASRPALTTRPANVERWYEMLLETAKGAAAEGQYDIAYRIAAKVDDAYAPGTVISDRSYGERDEYTNLTWFAGQTALKQLARPGDAVPMFDRYSQGSKTPSTQSKGMYWAARAAEAAGQKAAANGYFGRASGYGDQFYGQLATEHLGYPMQAPSTVGFKPVDPAVRDAFYRKDVVRAAQYLGTIGDHEGQTAFVRQIAMDAKTDTDHALAAQLSTIIGRPDLSVMVGRSALQNGLSDYRATGFPSVPVPDAVADQWTLIHAISRQESQFDRAAVSRAGARGLMQLMPGTAREQAGKLGLSYDTGQLIADTGYNVQLGSAYFRRLYDQYASFPLAVAAYNAGGGNVNKWLRLNGDPRTGAIDMVDWIEAIPFSETKNYVQRVLENAVVYDLMNPQRARSPQGSARLSWYLGRRPG